MSITINILSALSIVMGLFIPYFILLHLNNKLRKEVEGALNRVSEVQKYSEITKNHIVKISEISNYNFECQDENWKQYEEKIKLVNNAINLLNQKLKDVEKNLDIHIDNTRDAFRLHNQLHDKTVDFMEAIEKRINQKQTLKEILENPIEVKKEACETKVGLWSMGKVNSNKINFTEIDLSTIDEHILPSTFSNIENVNSFSNKKNFRYDGFGFKKDDIIKVENKLLSIERNGSIFISYHLNSLSGKRLFKKILDINAPKRKYRRRVTKEVANEAKRNLLTKK